MDHHGVGDRIYRLHHMLTYAYFTVEGNGVKH